MKINRLQASFGKLSNETISFHEGLNIVYAPNESGKSTWCAFIRAMLYGVNSTERARAGYLPDKQRYAPWSGAPMEGSMDFTTEHCDITITRSTRIPSAPMQEFEAVYTGTNNHVEGITSSNCGESFTGVSAEVFRRSAFVEQGSTVVTGSPELEKRIQSILSTGEEETSYSEAEGRLRNWQKKRRLNHKGMIPELENRIDSAEQSLLDIEESSADIREMENRVSVLNSECGELEQQIVDVRKRQREAIVREEKSIRDELNELTQMRTDCLDELNEKRDALRKSIFSSRDLNEVEQEAEADMERISALDANSHAKNSPVLMIIMFILTFAGMFSYEMFSNSLAVIIATAVFGIAAIVFLLRFMQRRNRIKSAENEVSGLLKKYAVHSPAAITDSLDEYHALNRDLQKTQKKADEIGKRYKEVSQQLMEFEADAVNGRNPSSDSSEIADFVKKLSAGREEIARLSSEIMMERGRLMTLGDPLVLKGSISTMKKKKDLLQEEYDAINLAIDTLKDADAEIQSRFSPQISELAAKYMSEMTDGRYEEVLLDRNFSAKAKTGDDVIAHGTEYLSAGTADLLYLAVRLAVCELALPSGEPCPLIIDDALVNLDETRYNQAMTLLREIAKERQVILFTCRK